MFKENKNVLEQCNMYLWYGCIETGDFQVRVGGRGSVSLHGDQPGRRHLL